jgi:hypothetical protein
MSIAAAFITQAGRQANIGREKELDEDLQSRTVDGKGSTCRCRWGRGKLREPHCQHDAMTRPNDNRPCPYGRVQDAWVSRADPCPWQGVGRRFKGMMTLGLSRCRGFS